MFKPVDAAPNFATLEEEVLAFWKKNKIFEKSVTMRPADRPWTFLDGPPFVTGMPHYGTLLSSLPKDVFGRYWTMKGYRVRRVWGWDGHGLPIENKVENALNVKRKKDIEDVIGVKKFIEECKKYVNDVSAEWEWYVDHIGRWADFKNAYKTWDNNYMESVMWVFKQLYEKNLVYKGLRVSLYCPHCATPISNFEVAMDAENHKDITEAATTYKYAVKGEDKTYLLAWSTTPWNKIVTPALAVNPKLDYVKVKQGDEFYILAKSTLKMIQGKYVIVNTMKGKDLAGTVIIPHYDFYKIEPGKKAFIVVADEFVTADEGTGIVTIAVYGEEDLKVMKEQNIQMVMHVDEEGMIKDNVPHFGGMYYLKANKAVNEDLAKRGLIYRDEMHAHSVAHCWRCATRLYHAPQNAWYVDVQSLKEKMKKTNESINWYPEHFKHGRFLKSMENAPDWNISRNRYWGSPVPVWECACGARFVPGSIAELEKASGAKITDLHKPEIDDVLVTCAKCGKKAKRTPEVLDSWIEAGSASFAERHYPFDSAQDVSHSKDADGKPAQLKDFFPPDYIAEYTGQIRAWFYVLHVIGAALYNSPAFKNVSVTGVILGTDGRKMSKNFKNYPDPKEMLQKYGGDALRLYLLGNPVTRGEDMIISEEAYRQQVRGLMLVLWNVYKFFVTYATLNKYTASQSTKKSVNILDKWIVSLFNQLVKQVSADLDSYDTVGAISHINEFVQDLSTWYLRRSRDRGNDTDFLSTLHSVLVGITKLLAPIAPFITEEMFKNLTGEESVHLTDWQTSDASAISEELMQQMAAIRKVVELGHKIRKEKAVKARQPLQDMFYSKAFSTPYDPSIFIDILKQELNIKGAVIYSDNPALPALKGTWGIEATPDISVGLDLTLTPELLEEGKMREIVRAIQAERKKLGTALDEMVTVELPEWPVAFEQEIKQKALVQTLSKAPNFKVQRTI